MRFLDFLALFSRFFGDLLVVILLYDFFVQPFRFYGMDPLTRFIWVAARKICAPFDTLSRKIVRLPDRDLTPIFTLVIVVFCRGLLYAVDAGASSPAVTVVFVGVTLSFQELFTRILVPGILFIIYADIQLAPHQETFIGNVLVMLVHDIAKRFIVMIRKLLISYRPLHVFVSVFFLLGLFEGLLLTTTLLPLGGIDSVGLFPRDLVPEVSMWLQRPFGILPLVYIRLAQTFLFGIFLLILMHMLAGFSGLDPYDRFSVLLGLVVSPWLALSRRLFPWARVGMIDFSIAILLLIPWFILGLAEGLLFRLV